MLLDSDWNHKPSFLVLLAGHARATRTTYKSPRAELTLRIKSCNFERSSLPALTLCIKLVYALDRIREIDSVNTDADLLLLQISHLESDLGILRDSLSIVQVGLTDGAHSECGESAGQSVH